MYFYLEIQIWLLKNSGKVYQTHDWMNVSQIIIEAEQFCFSSNAFETRNCIQFFIYIVPYSYVCIFMYLNCGLIFT